MLKEKYKTKSGFVYELLREKIISGEWPQGMSVVVSTVARELGVSAIPVREAMKQLNSEGLVVMEPHRGARVTVFNPEKIVEVMSIRGVLEGYAARTAMPFIDESMIADLRRIVDQMGRFTELRESEGLLAANKSFHNLICSKSPFPMLNDMILKLWDGGAYARFVFASRPEQMQNVHKEHIAILEAIELRDGDKAERLIREHKISLAEVLCEIL